MAQQSGGKDGGTNLNPFQLSGSTSSTNLFGASSGNSLFGKSPTSTPPTQNTGHGTTLFSNTFTEGKKSSESAPFGLAPNASVGNFVSSFSTPSTQVNSGGLFTSSVGPSTAVSSAQVSSFGTKGFGSGLKGTAFGTTNFGVSSSSITGSGTFFSSSSTTDSSSLFGNTTTSMPSTIFGNPLSSTTSFQNTTTSQNILGKDSSSESLVSKNPVFSGGVGFGTKAVIPSASQPDTGYVNFSSSKITSETSSPFSTSQPLPFSGAFVSKTNSSEKDHGSPKVVPEIQRPFQGVDFSRPKTVQGVSSVFGGAKDKTSLFGGLSNNDNEKVNLGNKGESDKNLRPPSISLKEKVGQSFDESSSVPSSSIPFHGSTPPVFGGANIQSDFLTSNSKNYTKNSVNIFGRASSNTFVSGKVFSKTDEKKSYSDSKKSLFENPSTEIEDGEIQDEQDDFESNRYLKTSEKKSYREDEFGNRDENIEGVFQSPESPERKSITKIIVVQIPDSCLDKERLRLHFSKFGKVERVSLNERSKQATINFSDHESASKAKRKGKKLHPKMPEVKIFYGTYVRRKSEDESSTKKILKEARRTARRSISRENEMDIKTRDYELDPYTPIERPGDQVSRPLLRDNSVGTMMKRIKSKQALFQTDSVKKKQEVVDHRGSKADSYKPYNLHERDEMDPYIPVARPESLIAKPKKFIQRDIPDNLSSVKFKRNKSPRPDSSDFRKYYRTEEMDEMGPYIPVERPELLASKSKKSIIQRDIPDDLGSVKIKKNRHPRSRSPNFHENYRVKERDELNPYNPIDRPELSAQNTSSKSKKKVIHRDIPDDLSLVKIKKNQPRASSPSIRDKESTEVTNSTDNKLLESIIRSQAQNNNSKHNILKARDRLIRPQIKRSGENLAATCPDMCPELERYKRDVQDYLSRYEKTNEVLDHRKVTKSFSRSSADKDEPLPWELRPGPVLSMTMDYLLCNILPRVDNEDEDLKVWYGYLCDRTRAIRNDLMTQGLIDSVAVHVMERCCRFHMYCSIKFCDAPVSTMDPKMNSEHLSKSLLTLKDLYFDLSEKGIFFETESEFRAYDMLLNLNSGNVMDQYVMYRDDVRRSKEVQYAVEILHTVKTKNYVKFFKLVQKGTYLQGCILHRFFQQVRKDAIFIIMKAYHTQKQKIPLSKILKILGFEDNEDAIVYLSYYGFEVHSSEEATEDFVIIDKGKFIRKPSEIPTPVYPHRLIESIRNCSPAEVIQGGPLPKDPLDYHIPNDSFDSQGYLKKESVNASDQLKLDNNSEEKIINVKDDSEHQIIQEREEIVNVDHVSDSETVETIETIEDVPTQIPALTNAEKIGYMKEIFDRVSSEIFGELIPPVAQEAIGAIKILYEKEAESVLDELIYRNVTEEIRKVSVSVIKDLTREEHERLQQKLQEEKKKRKELEELKSVAINSLLTDYVNQFVPEISNAIASEAIEVIEEETLYAVLQELEKELPIELEAQVVKEEIITISQMVMNDALKQEEKVKEFQEKMNKKVCGQVLNKWRDLALLARRRKQSCEEFPARASQLSLEEQNSVLGWGYDRKSSENLGVTKITELYSSNELEMKKILLLRDIEKKVAWFTLSIPSLLKDDIDNSSVVDNSSLGKNLLNHCFKVLIVTTPTVEPVVLQWLRAKLNPQVDADFTKPLKLCSSFVSRNTCLEYHVIMSEVDLQVAYNELHGELNGTNVAILVASEEDTSGYALQQMQCLLKDMEVPGTIIVTSQEGSLENNEVWYISPKDILNTETSERLQCLILKGWCSRNRNLSLHHNSFDDFVQNFIGDKVFDEAWKTHRERKSDYKSPVPFNAYIVLYNQAIDHLIDVLKDKDLAYLSWPPMEASELKGMPPSSWNGSTVEECANWLKNRRLSTLNMEGYMTWDKIQSKVDTYISALGLSVDASQLLLHEAQRILETYMVPDEENSNWEIHVLSLPWIELTQAIASYKLNHIPNKEVYYQPYKLNQFTLPEAWYAACDSFDLSWIQGRGHPRTKKRKDCLEDPFQQAPKKTFKSELRAAIEKEKEECAKIEKEREKEIEAINDELRLIYGMEI